MEETGALGVSPVRIKAAAASASWAKPLGPAPMELRKLVAGNWKMHGLASDIDEIRGIAAASRQYAGVDVALCLPAILIELSLIHI